ncbi:hypothetical protein QJQ45_018002, partial [Haematococcus lacustris]
GPSQHLTAAALQQPSAHATYIRASAGQLVQNGAGLVQAGEVPAMINRFAGRSQASQLSSGEGGLGGGAAAPGGWRNPHAGRGQASSITHSSGTVTVMQLPGEPEARRPAPGNGHWSTTYDNTFYI